MVVGGSRWLWQMLWCPQKILDWLFLNGRLLSSFVVPLWYVYLFHNMKKKIYFSSSRCVWVCSCGNWRWNEIADKRTKLRPLQDLWYQGPEPKHQLGGARRRRRSSLQRNVNQVLLIIQDYQQMCLSMDLKTCNKQNEISLDMNSQHIQVEGGFYETHPEHRTVWFLKAEVSVFCNTATKSILQALTKSSF